MTFLLKHILNYDYELKIIKGFSEENNLHN